MQLHSDYLLTASGSKGSNALAVGVIFALLVGAAGLAVGSLGIMSALLLAIPIFIMLVVNPLLGLLAVAIVVSFEVAFMLGGATLTRLVGPPVAVAWLTHKLLAKAPFKAILSERFVLASLLFFAFALASLMWAEYPVQVNVEFLRLGMLFALSVLVLDLLRDWKHVNLLVRALIVGATVAGLILWYRLPVHPLHKAILVGLVPYLLVFSVSLNLLESRGWEILPVVSYLHTLAFLAVLVYWMVTAWRPDEALVKAPPPATNPTLDRATG